MFGIQRSISAVAVHHAADYVAPDDLASPVVHAPIVIQSSPDDQTTHTILIEQSGFSRYVLREYRADTLHGYDGKNKKLFSSLSDAEKQTFLNVCRQCPDTGSIWPTSMRNVKARGQQSNLLRRLFAMCWEAMASKREAAILPRRNANPSWVPPPEVQTMLRTTKAALLAVLRPHMAEYEAGPYLCDCQLVDIRLYDDCATIYRMQLEH